MREEERLKYQWSEIWGKTSLSEQLSGCSKDELLPIYLKYLPKDGLILEGGAGYGRLVISLSQLGYKIIGVELIQKCVEMAKKEYPKIDMRQGDVNKLDFPDEHFSAYISMGVIEHFLEGPARALKEMYRVLKSNGIAIVCVPAFNWLRKIKYPLRNSLRSLMGESSFFRSLLGKKRIICDRQPARKNFLEQNKISAREVAKGKHASFGIDPEKGILFLEYRYPKNQLEKELKENGFEILESLPISHASGLVEDLGRLVSKNFTLSKGQATPLNLFGRFLNWFFKRLNAHIHNHLYVCVAQKHSEISAGTV